jgi:hypothetical protein
MSALTNIVIPSLQNGTCLEQYYRYLVGTSMSQSKTISDISTFQKLYVDTLVGRI